MKKKLIKLLVCIVSCTVILYISDLISQAFFSGVSTDLALDQVNGDDTSAAMLRGWESQKGFLDFVSIIICLLFCVSIFWQELTRFVNRICSGKGACVNMLLIIATLSMVSCRKPYDVPEYVEVNTNETAFLIPLEGDTGKQVQFDSAEALSKSKIASKRIQITHRWNQTGRLSSTGQWIANVRVIKVSRTPVTREWVAEAEQGSSKKDQAIWAESSDSVGFSTGFSCTAMVTEEDTSLFLYSYSGQSLSQMMDTEIRARIQSNTAEFSGNYTMDDLRDKKGEMMKSIREDVVPFFKEKGITITTIGQFGGFTYENIKIQDAIDEVFIAQQEKQVANAQLAAQNDKNKRLELEGEGEALKVRKIAEGQRDAAITEAQGRAEAISLVADAAKKAGEDPLFLQLKQLEAVNSMVDQWNGQYPTFMMNSGSTDSGGPPFLLNLPMPGTKKPGDQ